MALSGFYRKIATQVTGRLRYVSPICLAASEKVLHTSAVAGAIPDPKPVPLPKLKDRYLSISEIAFGRCLIVPAAPSLNTFNKVHWSFNYFLYFAHWRLCNLQLLGRNIKHILRGA